MLTNLVKSSFSAIIEISLWILLIGLIIGGWNLCESFRISGMLGAFIGFIIFATIIIPTYGFITIIINMDKNIEFLKNKNALQEDSNNETYSSAKTNPNNETNAVEKSTTIDKRDGKIYKTVKIGSQIWMAENLSYAAEGSKCYYGDIANCDKYGRLYDWNTAMKSCPEGWHLPTNKEWEILFRYVDGTSGNSSPYKSETAGKYLKAKFGWNENGNGSDSYWFAALPGGSCNSYGNFDDAGYYSRWWSASENDVSSAYYCSMIYSKDSTNWSDDNKNHLFSVRCVKD